MNKKKKAEISFSELSTLEAKNELNYYYKRMERSMELVKMCGDIIEEYADKLPSIVSEALIGFIIGSMSINYELDFTKRKRARIHFAKQIHLEVSEKIYNKLHRLNSFDKKKAGYDRLNIDMKQLSKRQSIPQKEALRKILNSEDVEKIERIYKAIKQTQRREILRTAKTKK